MVSRIFISRKHFLYLSLIGLIVSCVSGNEKLQFLSFSNGWPQNEVVQFRFTPEKINLPENLFLYLRNNDDYPFANIHLITTLENPIGEKVIDTLSYTMASPEGEWLGKGTFFSENKLWYKEAYRFNVTGEYVITIRHAMRHVDSLKSIDLLEGITAVGFGVEKINSL